MVLRARTTKMWMQRGAVCAVAMLAPVAVLGQSVPKQTPPVPAKPVVQPAKPATPAPAPAKPVVPPTAPVKAADAAKPAAAPKPAAPASKLDALAGNWDGAAQTANGELPIRVTLVIKDGKIGGAIESQMGVAPVTAGALNGEVLELGFDLQGAAGSLTGKVAGDRIEGSWSVSADSGGFVVTRNPPSGAAAPAGTPDASVAAADPISGEWEGAVDIGGQSMPFTLSLKVKGDVVTGEIGGSAAGNTPLSSGSWKDGTLSISFPYGGGEPVAMGGKIVDGKLAGVVNYNGGEMQGVFTATKKK